MRILTAWGNASWSEVDFEDLARMLPSLRVFSMLAPLVESVGFPSRFTEQPMLSFARHCPALLELEVIAKLARAGSFLSHPRLQHPFLHLKRLKRRRIELGSSKLLTADAARLLAAMCPNVPELELCDGRTTRRNSHSVMRFWWRRKRCLPPPREEEKREAALAPILIPIVSQCECMAWSPSHYLAPHHLVPSNAALQLAGRPKENV